jgi:hypothetical protein
MRSMCPQDHSIRLSHVTASDDISADLFGSLLDQSRNEDVRGRASNSGMKYGRLRRDPINVTLALSMHAEHATNTEIARALHCTPGAVRAFLDSRHLRSNPRTYKTVEMVDSCHARCSKCKQVKHISEWPKKLKKDGTPKLTYCKQCFDAQQLAAHNANPEIQLKRRLDGIRFRCRRDGTEYDLTDEHLIELWHAQSGRCVYTDVPLTLDFGNGRSQSNGPSIDRVRCEGGYVIGNVVIASVRANSIKRDITMEELRAWLPGWYQRVTTFLANFPNTTARVSNAARSPGAQDAIRTDMARAI